MRAGRDCFSGTGSDWSSSTGERFSLSSNCWQNSSSRASSPSCSLSEFREVAGAARKPRRALLAPLGQTGTAPPPPCPPPTATKGPGAHGWLPAHRKPPVIGFPSLIQLSNSAELPREPFCWLWSSSSLASWTWSMSSASSPSHRRCHWRGLSLGLVEFSSRSQGRGRGRGGIVIVRRE